MALLTNMRKHIEIDLSDRSIKTRELHQEDAVKVGRYLIAKTLLAKNAAQVDGLSPDNPLLFSAGPFAGTTYSNANRTSVGCKSPLTGGIKEANGGGNFAYAMGQLGIAAIDLYGAGAEWVVIHFAKDGAIRFEDASELLGKGNFEAAEILHAKFGKKAAIALCGPVGEYEGLLGGIAFSDKDGRPARIAARGGVGAVMGSKKVKAIVVDMDRAPSFHDPKAARESIVNYSKMLLADSVVNNFYKAVGTMGMGDYTNLIGGLPTRNFTSGQIADASKGEKFKMGGDFIGPMNTARGGEQVHACMPGCVIQCSNVYADDKGKEVVSPVEYETLGLLGTNCGITDPDELAGLNYICNDLGIDTIETGAMLAVLMDAGLAQFGDTKFMANALAEVRAGTEAGKLYAQGTARVADHFGVKRSPVIKRQAISAYDPRVIEVTGITMMTTAQGADHTAGNAPRIKSRDKEIGELRDLSIAAQIKVAAIDSLGLCIFSGTVTNTNVPFVMNSINAMHGTNLSEDWYFRLGKDTLRMEHEFNKQAGFDVADDDLPAFFYDEPLAPTNQTARFHGADVQGMYEFA